jgi:integrase
VGGDRKIPSHRIPGHFQTPFGQAPRFAENYRKHPTVWRRCIGPNLDAIGLEWVDFHVLRRTSSSLMNDLGDEGKVGSDQLGHGLDVNQNVYTQTSMKRRSQAVDSLETALKAS